MPGLPPPRHLPTLRASPVAAHPGEGRLLYRGPCQASPWLQHAVILLRFGSRCHTGLSLLFEVGVRPPHDGMRRMGRNNLTSALAANRRPGRATLRTHPIHRPREDIFLPGQNALISLTCGFPAFRRGFRQPREPWRRPCASGTRCHRPTSGAEPRPGVWRPRRWLDASRAAEPPACPTPSATTISRCG